MDLLIGRTANFKQLAKAERTLLLLVPGRRRRRRWRIAALVVVLRLRLLLLPIAEIPREAIPR